MTCAVCVCVCAVCGVRMYGVRCAVCCVLCAVCCVCVVLRTNTGVPLLLPQVNEVLTFHNADEGREGKEGKEGTKGAVGGAAGVEWGLLLPGGGKGVSISMETVLQKLASVKTLGARGDGGDGGGSDWDLCLTGASMDLIAEWAKGARQNYEEVLSKICPHVRVFARVTPQQKEAVRRRIMC